MLRTKNSNLLVDAEQYEFDIMYRKSRSGLWGICIYLAVTLLAIGCKDQSLATVLPPHLMLKLGAVPPVFMAVVVLWISTLSALTVISGRLFHGTAPASTRSQVAFRVGFYILFFVVGGLGQWFNELFVSGLVVLALQHYSVSSYYARVIDMNHAVCSSLSQESL
jgi:hypothetical protein